MDYEKYVYQSGVVLENGDEIIIDTNDTSDDAEHDIKSRVFKNPLGEMIYFDGLEVRKIEKTFIRDIPIDADGNQVETTDYAAYYNPFR